MHSSRMRTGRSLTVCWRMLPRGVCSWGVSTLEGSGLGGLLGGGGVSAWEVSARGASALGGSGLRGICSRKGGLLRRGSGCLLQGGICSQGGLVQGVSALGVWSQGVVSQHALRQTLPPWTESQTPVKTLPWPNFVAAGKYALPRITYSLACYATYKIKLLPKFQLEFSW